jgi:hypothetical protein
MTWKLYALASGGAFLATYFVLPPTATRGVVPSPVQATAVKASSIVDLGKQAERLHARLADTSALRHPTRNAFSFGESVRPRVQPVPQPIDAVPPVPVAPPRPPFALAGMAESMVDGQLERTAILTSVRGVQFAKAGDVVDGGYRVVAVGDGSVTLQSPDGSTESTLRLSTGDAR